MHDEDTRSNARLSEKETAWLEEQHAKYGAYLYKCCLNLTFKATPAIPEPFEFAKAALQEAFMLLAEHMVTNPEVMDIPPNRIKNWLTYWMINKIGFTTEYRLENHQKPGKKRMLNKVLSHLKHTTPLIDYNEQEDGYSGVTELTSDGSELYDDDFQSLIEPDMQMSVDNEQESDSPRLTRMSNTATDYFAEEKGQQSLMVDLLMTLIDKLTPLQRDTLLLQIEGGYSTKEIAERQKRKDGAVRTCLTEARKKLKAEFEKAWPKYLKDLDVPNPAD